MRLRPLLAKASGGIVSRFARGSAWNVVAAGSSQGSVLVTGLILANLMGAQLFGAYSLLTTTLNTLLVIAQLGTGLAVVKFVSELRATSPLAASAAVKECLRYASFGGVVVAALLIGFSGSLSTLVLRQEQLAVPFAVTALAVVFLSQAGVYQGILHAVQAFSMVAAVNALHGALLVFACVSGAYWWGLPGAAAGLLVSSGARALLFRRAARAEMREHRLAPGEMESDGFTETRVRAFIWPAAVSGLTTMPSFWLCATMLTRQPNGLVEVAWFSVALTLRSFVVLLPSLMTSVSAAMLNAALGRQDWLEFRQVLRISVVSAATIGVVAGGIIILGSDYILAAYGQEFAGADAAVLAGMGLACMEIVGGALYTVVVAHAKMWRSLFLIVLPRDATAVALAWLFSREAGAAGAIGGIAVAWGLSAIVVALWVRTLLHGTIQPNQKGVAV
jgi:O-antigen/teichoic acid export membrane protein